MMAMSDTGDTGIAARTMPNTPGMIDAHTLLQRLHCKT